MNNSELIKFSEQLNDLCLKLDHDKLVSMLTIFDASQLNLLLLPFITNVVDSESDSLVIIDTICLERISVKIFNAGVFFYARDASDMSMILGSESIHIDSKNDCCLEVINTSENTTLFLDRKNNHLVVDPENIEYLRSTFGH